MWMCGGFTLIEAGAVRTKNASMICLKNLGLYAIAALAYFFIGYNLMYVDVGSVIGSLDWLSGPSPRMTWAIWNSRRRRMSRGPRTRAMTNAVRLAAAVRNVMYCTTFSTDSSVCSGYSR